MKSLALFILFSLILVVGKSQDSSIVKREYVFYTFFVNVVPNHFNLPLIGFVNVAKGNYKGSEIGFVNTNGRNLKGAQIGFVNSNLGKLKGAQIGFVNTVIGDAKGSQIGFVNTAFKKIDGLQIGFVNTAKSMKGLQLGFVNFADTLESGIPLGFISFVRRGGYQGLEVSIHEMYPYNLSFKTGVRQLYSTLEGSYNPSLNSKFAIGLGLGSFISLSEKLYFNPEIVSRSAFSANNVQMVNLTTQLNYDITKHFQILVGPSLTWQYNFGLGELHDPIFSIYESDNLNAENQLVLGVKLALRYHFSPIVK